jgi:hypothetical protein
MGDLHDAALTNDGMATVYADTFPRRDCAFWRPISMVNEYNVSGFQKRFHLSEGSTMRNAVSLLAATLVGLTVSVLFAPLHAPAADSAHSGLVLSPIFGLPVPDGYREWPLVSVSHRTDDKDELRAILANPIAFKALRAGALPLPDGSVLAKLAWKREPMLEFAGAFKPGAAPRIEFMYKDTKKFGETGGWGFARFIDGRPADEAAHRSCFPCHAAKVQGRDFVFTRFAP